MALSVGLLGGYVAALARIGYPRMFWQILYWYHC
jgi:hypothetical protein